MAAEKTTLQIPLRDDFLVALYLITNLESGIVVTEGHAAVIALSHLGGIFLLVLEGGEST